MAVVSQLAPQAVFARDYRVLGLIAEGGMGAVYAAEQISTGKRRALKIMLSELVSDPKARMRFEQEARIAAQIPSEHVVEVVGAGVDEQTGTPWLAMELLEGSDLGRVVRERGRLTPDVVHQCFQQLGHALGMAHQRGIVHRDLKPENLFLATSQRVGVPFTLKVLDFGIAKLNQENRATQRTAAMGSPLWMAPEQTEQSQLSPRTDVWALGLIAFYLLTGRVYWRSANQEDVRLAGVLTELLVSPLDPPTVRAAQLGVHEPLPPGFDGWFARCVARSPSERFADATTAIAALGPNMSFRGDASQPFAYGASPVPPTSAMPRVAATMPLAAYPSSGSLPPGPIASQASPSGPSSYASSPGAVYNAHGSQPGMVAGHASQPGMVAGHASQPGMVAGPFGQVASSPGVSQPRPGLPLAVRVVLFLGGLVLAVGCTAGITFGALHAWQTYGPGSGGPPPAPTPAPIATLALPDAGPAFVPIPIPIPVAIDAGLDAGRAHRDGTELAVAPEADTSFAWADGDAHQFRGTARGTDGLVADFVLTVNRNGGSVDGFFHWTVREIPPGSSLYVGQTLDEGVGGSWSAPALTLATAGSSSATDYQLTIRGNGRLSGRSSDGMRYSGRLAR